MNLPGLLRFHHVGLACRDLGQEARRMGALGYEAEGEEFTDPVQGVRGLFLAGQQPRTELLCPLQAGGVLEPWLRTGVKLYHYAYEVQNLPAAVDALRGQRAKLVVGPVPAVAFGGRPIAFLMMPNMLLVELVAARTTGGSEGR